MDDLDILSSPTPPVVLEILLARIEELEMVILHLTKRVEDLEPVKTKKNPNVYHFDYQPSNDETWRAISTGIINTATAKRYLKLGDITES